MKHSESISAIAKALAEFQAEVSDPVMDEDKDYVTKTGRKINLKYASIKSIMKTVRPVLAKHGIAVMQEPKTEGNRVTITTILMHSSGEWIEFEPFSMNASTAIAQEIGSATTYAKRYSIAAILGLGAEEDDDGNGATEGIDTKNGKSEKKNNEKPVAKPAQNAAQNPSPAPAQNAQPKNVQPKQQAPQAKSPEKKTDDSITREQQSALFHAAKGKNDIVKEVLMNHAYVSTAEIKTWDYEGILKEITEKAS